jgi:hypothetical protein
MLLGQPREDLLKKGGAGLGEALSQPRGADLDLPTAQHLAEAV